ncbi:nuclear valosin-containing protein-like isoform X2 [Physella acuta]|uniref:nuclear valosin-containing protein-like isoform X2 n=1 Tax=Physella acuta TaxID=109671 RepID=UPI0027DADA28|nr:nuclear valosin-containing protein-like isoform X2 [Physella acuta]
MPKPAYFLDDRLVPRIKQILKAEAHPMTAHDVAERLLEQYSDYARKKKNMFLKSVEKGFVKACQELVQEGMSTADSNSEDDSSLGVDKNIMNNMISQMYRRNDCVTEDSAGLKVGGTSQNILLEISQADRNAPPPTQADRNAPPPTQADRNAPPPTQADRNAPPLTQADRNAPPPTQADRNAPPRKRKRLPQALEERKIRQLVHPGVTFESIGGNTHILKHIEERCHFLAYPELLEKIKGDLPKCFLFHGPTGCGKTLLANAIAGEYKLPLLAMTATELIGGISGDSESNIRDLFLQAAESAPCVLLIDDIDAIATKRETASKGMETRLVTQLANSMDDLRSKNVCVLVICATNRPNSLDEAFRRTGRFDIEYALRFPNREGRKSILDALCRDVVLGEDVSLSDVADLTPGYVGSDLKTLISITNACAFNRKLLELAGPPEGNKRLRKVIFSAEDLDNFQLTLLKSDFQKAMTEVKPTAKQEDVLLVPNTTWDDIGGLDNIRKQLNLCIMERTKRPELYQALGMSSAAGVLLVGPPGCGKTSVARAVANEAGINFLYIKGPELLNKYVGESEKNVRDLFKRAGSLAPCVIFFDEIDSICPRRSSSSEENSTSRVTNQLLLEMSGLEQRTEVYVIAATNRLDRLDKAFLRPGRMDKIIYVGLPTPNGRVEILRALTKNGTRPKLATDVDLNKIGRDKRCDGFSGADLGNLVQVAREVCLEQIIEATATYDGSFLPQVNLAHFEVAFGKVKPSVDNEAKRNYEAVRKLLEHKAAQVPDGLSPMELE